MIISDNSVSHRQYSAISICLLEILGHSEAGDERDIAPVSYTYFSFPEQTIQTSEMNIAIGRNGTQAAQLPFAGTRK